MTNNTVARSAPVWVAVLAFFIYRAATTGALQQASTYVGILVGVALVASVWAVAHRRAKKSAL